MSGTTTGSPHAWPGVGGASYNDALAYDPRNRRGGEVGVRDLTGVLDHVGGDASPGPNARGAVHVIGSEEEGRGIPHYRGRSEGLASASDVPPLRQPDKDDIRRSAPRYRMAINAAPGWCTGWKAS
jgi:hypothetical protein